MTTPEQAARRAEVDQFIADWMAAQVVKFDRHVARDAEMYTKAKDRGDDVEPDAVAKSMNDMEFGEHMRVRFPVGVFLDNTEYDDTGKWKPSASQLFQVFETGKMMITAALGHPDATEEFLKLAREEWGHVTDEILRDMCGGGEDIPRRDPVTNEWV